jgi:hypothetical protein
MGLYRDGAYLRGPWGQTDVKIRVSQSLNPTSYPQALRLFLYQHWGYYFRCCPDPERYRYTFSMAAGSRQEEYEANAAHRTVGEVLVDIRRLLHPATIWVYVTDPSQPGSLAVFREGPPAQPTKLGSGEPQKAAG